MPPVFVDARTLADRLDVGYGTVLTWVRRGRIPHVRNGRGRYLFNLESVTRALLEADASASEPRPTRKGGVR